MRTTRERRYWSLFPRNPLQNWILATPLVTTLNENLKTNRIFFFAKEYSLISGAINELARNGYAVSSAMLYQFLLYKLRMYSKLMRTRFQQMYSVLIIFSLMNFQLSTRHALTGREYTQLKKREFQTAYGKM